MTIRTATLLVAPGQPLAALVAHLEAIADPRTRCRLAEYEAHRYVSGRRRVAVRLYASDYLAYRLGRRPLPVLSAYHPLTAVLAARERTVIDTILATRAGAPKREAVPA